MEPWCSMRATTYVRPDRVHVWPTHATVRLHRQRSSQVHAQQQTVHQSIAWSDDGGRTFSAVYFAPTLPDPVVEGSMIFGRYTPPELGVGLPLFFTNPASEIAREVRPITVLNGRRGVGRGRGAGSPDVPARRISRSR